MATDFLTLADIAEMLNVKSASARVYHEVAQRNRRARDEHGVKDAVRPTDMPEPYARIGRTPIWRPADIEEWMTRRTPRRRTQSADIVDADQEVVAA